MSAYQRTIQKLFTEQISRTLQLDLRCHARPDLEEVENKAAYSTICVGGAGSLQQRNRRDGGLNAS